MKFIVIEGDNGTGKDSLAQQLKKCEKIDIITYNSDIKKAEKVAKKFSSEKKVRMFLGYNKLCSDLVKSNNQDSLLIRYWISTLAAAYADGVYDYERIIELSKRCIDKLEVPDCIIRLKCNYSERIKRIEGRNSNDYDDKTIQRDIKYQYITDKLKEQLSMIKWIDINTTDKSKEIVFKNIYEEIHNKDLEL